MNNEDSDEVKLGKLYLIKTMVQDLIKLLGPDTSIKSAKEMFPLIRMIDALIDIYGENATLSSVEKSDALSELTDEQNLRLAKKVVKIPETKPATIENVIHTLINMGYADLSLKSFLEYYEKSIVGVPDFITTRPLDNIRALIDKYSDTCTIREVYYKEMEDF